MRKVKPLLQSKYFEDTTVKSTYEFVDDYVEKYRMIHI